MDPTLAGFRAFVEVADRHSIRAAADQLGYTASAISQRLSSIESALGVELFERHGNRLTVSLAGEQILPYALRVLASAEEVAKIADRASEEPTRQQLRLGGFPSGLSLCIVPHIHTLAQEGVALEIEAVEHHKGETDLRLGHLDLLLIQEYSTRRPRDAAFAYHTVMTEPLVMLSPDLLDLENGASHQWIISHEETTCGAGVRQLCRVAGFEPNVVACVDDFGLQQELVVAGLGSCVMPKSSVHWDLPASILRTELSSTRTIVAVTRRSMIPDLGVDHLLKSMGQRPERVAPFQIGDGCERRA